MSLPALVVIAVITQPLSAKRVHPVFKSYDESIGKYPFVVTLLTQSRHCTGTFIASNWVLTGGHCFPYSQIQHKNMTIPAGQSNSMEKPKNINLKPPSTYSNTADIGLLYVQKEDLKAYGRLSSMDYKDLLGQTVEFADFDYYYKKWKNKNYTNEATIDSVPRLHLGQGVVKTCDTQTDAPHICVVALETDSELQSFFGDPGGPLFFDGKVVGVLSGGSLNVRFYTPVSPYLPWLNKVHNATVLLRNNGEPSIVTNDVPVPIQHQMIQNLSQYLLGLKVRLRAYREKVLSTLLQQFQKRRRSARRTKN